MPPPLHNLKATREEALARYREVEDALVVRGLTARAVARELIERHRFTSRTAHRYVNAVRDRFAKHASEEAATLDELLVILMARSDAALQQTAMTPAGELTAEPDHKASIKALELYARLRGWLDKRTSSTVDVRITGSVAHVDMTDWSDEELALHAQLADARARRLAAGGAEREVIDTTAVVEDAHTAVEVKG